MAAAVGPAACSCERGRARHLERAVSELEAARVAWGVWADGVRKLAELRLGISVTEGFAVLDDPARLRQIVGISDRNGVSKAMPRHIVDAIAGANLP